MEFDLDTMGDAPIEVDCPGCGSRHILEPVAVRAFLRQRRFRCGSCDRRRRMTELSGIRMDHGKMTGHCEHCDG